MWKLRSCASAVTAVALLALSACVTAPSDGTSPPTAAPGKARPETIGARAAPVAKRPATPWTQSSTYTAAGPFPVQLATVPVGEFDTNNKLDRGWGQQGKARRIPGPIPAAEVERLREAARTLAPSDRINAAQPPSDRSPLAGLGFPSIDYTQCCGGGGNVPPDPELAVGPNHIIAVVNVAFAIYDKSGALLAGPFTISSLFSPIGGACSAVFDPNVLYDE